MTFHKHSLKLAGIYLAILMCISLFFSANLYQLSVQELERSLRRPPSPESIINRLPFDSPQSIRVQILQERERQYLEARDRIINRLIVINSIILVTGGILSYYFALRTLRPIEKAHEAQSRFTADASHELRTPIAVMQAEIEVALMDPKLTLPKAKTILRSNIEELAKLTALSEGLLKLARAERAPLQAESINLSKLISECIDRAKNLAHKKQIVLDAKVLEGVHIQAEKQSLSEAILIVLDNAIKYSSQKSTVTITLREESKDAYIEIKDQGIGMRPAELPHIFERFYRADSARSKHTADGYGIGLALAKNIIDMHRGKIKVESTFGVGSVFSIVLPK